MLVGDFTTEIHFHIVVPLLCGIRVVEVLEWRPQTAKGGSSLSHRLVSMWGQPLECVIILMSCGACRGMWSGRLLLWYGDNWACQEQQTGHRQTLSRPQAVGKNDALRDAANYPGFCFSDVYDHSRLISPSSKTRRKTSIGDDLDTGGRFWHQPLTVSDEKVNWVQEDLQRENHSHLPYTHTSQSRGLSGPSQGLARLWAQ